MRVAPQESHKVVKIKRARPLGGTLWHEAGDQEKIKEFKCLRVILITICPKGNVGLTEALEERSETERNAPPGTMNICTTHSSAVLF